MAALKRSTNLHEYAQTWPSFAAFNLEAERLEFPVRLGVWILRWQNHIKLPEVLHLALIATGLVQPAESLSVHRFKNQSILVFECCIFF